MLTVRSVTVTAYSLSALAVVTAVLCLLMLMQTPARGKHASSSPPIMYTRDMETAGSTVQQCRAKLGDLYRMHECNAPCQYLTLGQATAQRRGSYSGWYHIDPTLDATHWPVPASAL